jgi:hypothetical protein
MKIRVAVAVLGIMLAGLGACASRERPDDGPARAMTRLPKNTSAAAEGYIDALNGLATTLRGVTDSATARSALPALEGHLGRLTAHLRELEGAEERVQADARYAFYRTLASADRQFDGQVSRVKGTPGVGTILSPLLDKIPRWR